MTTLPVRFLAPAATLFVLTFNFACANGQTHPATAAPQASAQSKVLPVVLCTMWRDAPLGGGHHPCRPRRTS